jgi:hypothetical protein
MLGCTCRRIADFFKTLVLGGFVNVALASCQQPLILLGSRFASSGCNGWFCMVAPGCTQCLDRFNLSPDFLTVMRGDHPVGAMFSFAPDVLAVHPPTTGLTNGHHHPWR